MTDRKTTRTFRIEGDNIIAVKQDEFTNGKGKKVIQIVEEHSISKEEINDVLEKYVDAEKMKVREEMDKIQADLDEINFEEDEEYKKFKEMINDENNKKMFEKLGQEKAHKQGHSRLKELQWTLDDIEAWRKQFEDMAAQIGK